MYTTDRLLLRAYTPDDDAFLLALYDDPSIQATLTSYPNKPLTTAFLTNVLLPSVSSCYFHCVICIKPIPGSSTTSAGEDPSVDANKNVPQAEKRPVPIGIAFLEHFDSPKNRSAMYSVSILPRWQGLGYGSEVTSWIVDWAFNMGGLRRVWLSVFEGNEKAIRAYEKAGFEKTWVARKENWRDGRWLDTINMAILDEDYWKRKRKLDDVAQ